VKTFQFNSFGAAALFTVLAMGVIGVLVVLPIASIQWTWNEFVPGNSVLPSIDVWQAILLYLAAATALFLSGIIQIEIDTDTERTE
jgi:hypothetical protein